MSTPTQSPTQQPTLLQPGPFRERLLVYLLPYFMPFTADFDLARADVLETLASYGARTRSEMISAARIIAFSFSALELLAEAKSEDLPPELRLRYRISANLLNRSCQQTERTLVKTLACDTPGTAKPARESIDDMSQPEIDAALAHAKARIDTYRNRLSGARPAAVPQAGPAPRHASNPRPTGSAILNALAQTWPPAQPTSAS